MAWDKAQDFRYRVKGDEYTMLMVNKREITGLNFDITYCLDGY
jgi:hypothetical protein